VVLALKQFSSESKPTQVDPAPLSAKLLLQAQQVPAVPALVAALMDLQFSGNEPFAQD